MDIHLGRENPSSYSTNMFLEMRDRVTRLYKIFPQLVPLGPGIEPV